MNYKLLTSVVIVIAISSPTFAQKDSVRLINHLEQNSTNFAKAIQGSRPHVIHYDRRKLIITTSIVAAAYTGSMIVLGESWYKNQERESFHFFNDAAEWKQMDKVGHTFATWQVSAHGASLLRNCGVDRLRSARIASIASFAMISSIEVYDGFASGYGASWSDLGANAVGALGYFIQESVWGELRITPKYSFHFTSLAAVRPALLGDGIEEILKDYNGQTQWLSFDIKKFAKNSRWPAWLNVAGGYGAENMISARDASNIELGYDPYRQYYLSLDVNWKAIPARSRFLKTVFTIVDMVKFPAPAFEVSRKGMRVHAIYF